MDLGSIDEAVDALYRDKKWIITADVSAGATSLVDAISQRDHRGVMVVAGNEGIGDQPSADRVHLTRSGGDTIMEGFREFHQTIEEPSRELMAAVDTFDPDGTALVRGQGFSRQQTLAGRRVYGRRPKAWGDLEDKTTIGAIWHEAGIPTASERVVLLDQAAVAANELATSLGSVWAADNYEGWHGGGEYTKWVKSPNDIQPTVDWLAGRVERVRVMPFLEGLPCSIHGFITGNGIAVFRPVELYILRTLDPPGFFYARVGNLWQPSDAATDSMRGIARAVGEVLDRRFRYRGSFGIDGVLTSDGFLPTELNPRMSVGSGIQWFATGLPLGDMELMLLEGDLEIDAVDLENFVTTWAKANRRATFMFPSSTVAVEPAATGFRFEQGDVVAVPLDESDEPVEESDGTMQFGRTAFGSVVFARLDADRIERGPSTAPLAIPLMQLARDLWQVDLPECAAADEAL